MLTKQASDGLWDKMSSADAVTCVEMWLEKFTPTQSYQEKSTSSPQGASFPFGSVPFGTYQPEAAPESDEGDIVVKLKFALDD